MIARLAAACVAALAIGLFSGCSGSELMSSAKSPSFDGVPFKKVMIVGMAKRPEVRRMYEDAFVQQLKAAGVDGVASYSLIPDVAKANKDSVAQAAKKAGVEAVLVTRLVEYASKTYVFPADPRMELYIGTDLPDTHTPTEDYVSRTLVLESRLFGAPDAKAVWTGTTQTLDPGAHLRRSVTDLSALIVKALVKDKLI